VNFQNLFRNNKEEFELLNYFQKFISNQQSAAPQKMLSEALGLSSPFLRHRATFP